MDASADHGEAADDGVLGKLPRSRPGQRSDKRGGRSPAPPRETGASRRGARSGPEAAGRPRGAARQSPERSAVPPDREREPAVRERRGPIGEAADLAGRAARLGLGAAGGVLKRLPRP